MTAVASAVHRVEVWPRADQPDPAAATLAHLLAERCGQPAGARSAMVFLIEASLDAGQLQHVASELLADPVAQEHHVGAMPLGEGQTTIEIHYKPGVMDPVAQSVRAAILEMFADQADDLREHLAVRTGRRFDASAPGLDAAALGQIARQALANPVIQDLFDQPFHPERFPTGSPYQLRQLHVPIRELDDAGLTRLSREGHLFLSLDEMKAIQDYYRQAEREPTDIELETLAQTWSEHCVHKTLKARIRYQQPEGDASPGPRDWRDRPGHQLADDGSMVIDNLLKSTIAAATGRLMREHGLDQWCVSVFKDNAGIVKLDDQFGVCIKVETHNHPSAIEPYGGAATGVGGCIRDVMGTGLAGKPIANTDVFCVARGDHWSADAAAGRQPLPKGVIHPTRILQQVVAGVRDYGNRMGIPTVNGAVWYHDDYIGNPLVFCGCVGLIPLDKAFGAAQEGDHIIVLGGRTGRDGIHGATFSSAELTDSHADEFSHAVQIGNAITQKTTLDVILQARDNGPDGRPLFNAITDCGAGGFSSAVGEMGQHVGAVVQLDRAPLKYQGLSYTEIWISEAQERMVLAVPPQHVAAVRALADGEDVEVCDLGVFGCRDGKGEPELALRYADVEVGRLAMGLLHDGIPTPTREAKWEPRGTRRSSGGVRGVGAEVDHTTATVTGVLHALLAHPNIASKQWIIRQYDHEVQGGSVIKPLVGAMQDGPSDAAVLRPRLDSERGVALGVGLATGLGEDAVPRGGDSYWMTLAAIDEAVRNVVCTGADPTRIALLDNFCWPSCQDPANLGSLVRAAEACHDGAMAFKAPFVSGKDSLNNQFTTDDGRVIRIPPTLLITAMGLVPDVTRCRTMDAKAPGHLLLMVGVTTSAMGGSHYMMLAADPSRDGRIPQVDLEQAPRNAAAVADLIGRGWVVAAHDCSDGGMLVAAAEMAFAGGISLDLDLAGLPGERVLDELTACFAETPSRYLVEVAPEHLDDVLQTLRRRHVPFGQIGAFVNGTGEPRLTLRSPHAGQLADLPLAELKQRWQSGGV